MDTSTLLIIIIVVLIVLGGGWTGRSYACVFDRSI